MSWPTVKASGTQFPVHLNSLSIGVDFYTLKIASYLIF